MSYEISTHKRFVKVVKKLRRSGDKHLIAAVEEVVQLLKQSDDDIRARWALHHQWDDHALEGHRKEMRELHLGKDALLIYRREERRGLIKLQDIMSHEELRKRGR